MARYDYQKNRRHALPEYISIISANSYAKIRIDDIEVLEQNGKKIRVVTASKSYTFYGTINTIAESLAERAFFRPLKRMIINLDHISEISGYSIIFGSGQSVTVGKNALLSTKRAYKRYLLRYPPYTTWEPIQVVAGTVAEPYAGDETIRIKDRNGENDEKPRLLN